MAIKLVAMDMDDTLLNAALEISPHNAATIARAVEQGVLVTIATGRMYCSTAPYARKLGLDVPLIVYNGAMIKSGISGEVLYHKLIAEELSREVLAFFRQHGWYVQSYVDDTLYVEQLNATAKWYADFARVEAIALGEPFYTSLGAPTKILSLASAEQVQVMYEAVCREFGERLFVTISKPEFLEMVHPEVSKGRALAFLAAKYGICQEEVLAIGDSGNDLDMIAYAGLGVAMGNAAAAIKQAADVITGANTEDGVALAIEKYVLGKDID